MYSVSAIVVLPYMSQSNLQETQQNPNKKPRLSVQKHELFVHFINRIKPSVLPTQKIRRCENANATFPSLE